MTRSRRAVAELGLAVAALVGSVLSWLAAQTSVAVAPVADGEPTTTSVIYQPSLVMLALFLATVAGVLAVLGIARYKVQNL